MSDKVYRFKIRRMERLLRRMDAADGGEDEDEGRWITTENGHHVHLNEEGEPDKGNPHVIEKMTDESGSEESSGKKKKRTMQDFVDLIDKFPETVDGSQKFWRAVEDYLKEAPKETKIGFKDEDGEWIKIEDGYWINSVDGNIIDNDEMLEMFADEEFGQYSNDDMGITYEEPDLPSPSEESSTTGAKERTIQDFVDLFDKFPDSMEGQKELWRTVKRYLEEAPNGAEITLPSYRGVWVKGENGWKNDVTGGVVNNSDMVQMFSEEDIGVEQGSAGITYSEHGSDRGERRVGRSDAEKRITAILEEGYQSGYTSGETEEKLKKELDALPDGSFLLVKKEYWDGTTISVVKKTPEGYEIDGDLEDEDELIEVLEESDHELDVISSDEFESVTIRGKSTHDLFRAKSQRWKTVDMLSRAPEGTEIRFKPSSYQGEDETILVRESGRWYDADLDMYYNDNDVYNYMRDVGFVPSESEEQASELVEYREPDKKKYFAKKSERHTFEGCTSFSDKADDTHSYAGDGQEQIDFFYENSNFDELLEDLDYHQEEALRAYTEGELMRSYAHSGWDEMPSYIQDMVQSMDEVIDQATLDEGVVVTRLSNAALLLGYDNKQALLTELKAMVGKRVVSKGFMSCGAADEGLSIGNRHKMVEYKIGVPGGSVGAGMWLGDDRINDWGAQQREFCLNRDTEYEVKSVNFDPERGIYTVAMEYVGRQEHDYGE